MAMWLNCMPPRQPGNGCRFATWCASRERRRTSRACGAGGTSSSNPLPAETRAKPPTADLLVRATSRGRFGSVYGVRSTGVIEQRWRRALRANAGRFAEGVPQGALVSGLDASLPDCMPILGVRPAHEGPRPAGATPAGPAAADLSLPALPRPAAGRLRGRVRDRVRTQGDHSRSVLTCFVCSMSGRSALAGSSDARRGFPGRRSTWRSDVLEERRLAAVEADPSASRGKVVRLTGAGVKAQDGAPGSCPCARDTVG